jgi:hypothetical protein
MKRFVTFALFGLANIALFGCPIYGDSGDYKVCNASGCYRCPDSDYSSRCVPWGCGSNLDCPSGTSCRSGQCVTSTTGDCTQTGCQTGYVCKLLNGTPQCVADSLPDGGGIDAAKDGGLAPECMSDTTCVMSKGQGAKCLNGTCVAPQDQCVDGTQCQNGYQCVEGVCTPGCGANMPCPTGYSCDTQKGVCTGNPNPCTMDSQCGGNVCVEGHCVPPCGNGCGLGFVCVGGGCIPDQKPQFVCNKEGVQDVCKMGSICLRHNCYIACDLDASMSCQNADQFKVCKSVTTQSGTYSVCGSNTNLGSECDVTINKNCTNNGICIDGYCR